MLKRGVYAARFGARATNSPPRRVACLAATAAAAAAALRHAATSASPSATTAPSAMRGVMRRISAAPLTTSLMTQPFHVILHTVQRMYTSDAASSTSSPAMTQRSSTDASNTTAEVTSSAQQQQQAHASASASASAVNVESFTLNEEVVQRDMDALKRWNAIAAALDEARTHGRAADIIAQVEHGLALLSEEGAAEHAPIQCECLLCMEAAQAEYNAGDYDAAMRYAERALASVQNPLVRSELQDGAQIAEVRQLMGYILCRKGEPVKAQAIFESVLHWIDVDAKTAMPMQAVAALNLRRSVLTGLAQSWTKQADEVMQRESGDVSAARALYGRALDVFIEALDRHVDEKDGEMVKMTLEGIRACFEGVGDMEQAETTCTKYRRWCERHEDAAGVAYAEHMLEEQRAREKERRKTTV